MDDLDVFVDLDGYVRVTNREDVDLALTHPQARALVEDLNDALA